MFEFRTLGAIELRGDSGERIESLLPHSKRLALLAYLAASYPPGLHRRDTIVAMLWPEQDDAHARGVLRHELYQLRRVLGPGVLRTAGGETLGINPERLWCDASALDAAVDGGRLEEALDLWRGEFLPGLHVEGGEFERWLDGARDRLARRVVEAGRRLSTQAEAAGDAGGAVAWARRLTVLAPYDEKGWQRLITLLDRSGDRASALVAYEELTTRLRDELEVEPSPETRALVDAIRERGESFSIVVDNAPGAQTALPPGASGRTPEPPFAAPERLTQADYSPLTVARAGAAQPGSWPPLRYIAFGLPALALLVAAWVVMRPAGPGPVVIALPEVTNLAQEPALDPFASWVEERLAAVLGGAEFVDLITAGAPERVRAVISTSVYRRGELVEVRTRIAEPGDGGRVLDILEPALCQPESADSALGEMESRLLGALAIRFDQRFEAAGVTGQRLPIDVPRYEAYREYLIGQDLFARQEYRAAVPHMARAYRLDSGYGKAAVFGAIALAYSGQLAAADSLVTAVLERGDSLTERDLAFARWVHEDLRGQRERAYRAARDFERTSAGASPSAYAVAALEAVKFNRPREALRTFQLANVDHGWLRGFAQLWEWWAGTYHMVHDHHAELSKAREGRERFPESLKLLRSEVRARAALHDTGAVEQLLEEALSRAPGVPGETTPADVAWIAAQELAAHGDQVAAAAARRTAVGWLEQRPAPRSRETLLHARLLLELGNTDAAQRLLAKVPPREDPDWLGLTGLVAAQRGDTAAARDMLDRLEHMQNPYLSGQHLLMASGIHTALGRHRLAVQTLQRALENGLPFGVELHALPMLAPLAERSDFKRLLRPRG